MICLSGTIPMPYKGNTYNIPVNIWIHADYPTQAPIVLVTPTKDMQIKPSKIVDNNGRVYLPYLHEWKPMVSSSYWSIFKFVTEIIYNRMHLLVKRAIFLYFPNINES